MRPPRLVSMPPGPPPSSVMPWQTSWIPAFLEFVKRVKVPSKEMVEPAPIVPYEAQFRFLRELDLGLNAEQHFFVVLKARQLGLSTIMLLLDVFWLYMHPGLQGAIVADTDENRIQFRETLTQILSNLPPGFRIRVKRHNRAALVLENDSRLQYLVAGKGKNPDLGRSRGLNFLHACVAPGTPVILYDGHVKPIEEIKVGDGVLTHTGAKTMVVDVLGQENTKGDLIRITPWLGQALDFTTEHTIPTTRGLLEASEVRSDDWLLMPLRKINTLQTHVRLPTTPKRPQGAGAISIGSGAIVPLTEEFGFACGYYLAEGTILAGSGEKPAAITFSRHRDETAYADRACNALSGLYRKRATRLTPNSKGATETIYGSSLAAWMKETFICDGDKFIPDEVFSWGPDFCRGLLAGILCGDGSKTCSDSKSGAPKLRPRSTVNGKRWGRPPGARSTQSYPTNKVVLPTTRSSLAMQTRDLAAALGYGWGSMSYTAGGLRYGRQCKPIWRISWTGSAAHKLRDLMGLPAIPRSGKDHIQKYKIEDGFVKIRIRKIETGIKCDRIWDISVAHDDHTFRTPYFAIGNTELATWGDQNGIHSLIDALATENPNRLYILESTAKGYNVFHSICATAKNDSSQRFMFIGWWAKEVYRIKAGTAEYDRWWGSNPQLSEQEQIMEDLILQDYNWQMTTEQWAWWRKQSFDRSETNLLQEFPWHEKVAFQVTGSPFFANKRLAADLEFVSTQSVTFNGYRYELPSDFALMRCEQVFKADDAELKIWEPPIRGARYAIGVDVAYGRSDGADRHCIQVYRCFADKLVQVAEWATPLPETRHVAWVLAHLAGSYRDCIINLEISGPGAQVMQEMKHLRQLIQYAHLRDMQPSFEARGALDQARWFLFHRPESMAPGYTYGWKTTNENKLEMFNGFRDGYNTEQVVVRSVKLLQEMQTLIQNGVKIGGSAGKKDDRPFASGLADYAWRHWIRPDMISRNETFARQKAAEKSLSKEGQNVVRGIIPAWFATCDKERRERAIQEILNRSY